MPADSLHAGQCRALLTPPRYAPLIQRNHSNSQAPAWQALPISLRQHSHMSGNPGTQIHILVTTSR